MRELYFRRTARFDLLNGHIVVADPKQPRMVTLDPWLELVFQMADGEHTIDQMIVHLGKGYEGGSPAGLDQQVLDIVNHLVAEGFVELVANSTTLPFYLTEPVSKQDAAEAKAAMLRDGFIK
ncbi:MAG: hypothetical protein L0Y72_25025 [Gemmataceae bacterium]|nr:hypothetical protein [Gemmataceae bacterium]MCI0742308.1 hypothetical protein [Gemmataceae bacterium]